VSLLAVIAASLSPLLAADTIGLSFWYGKIFTSVALLTGWHLFGVGVGGILFVPSSRIWGKRHAFLLGNIILVFASAWGGGSGKNYTSALAARVFQGFGLAPFEGLVNAIVGDLYFVHERGKRMAVSNFCVFGGAFMTPVIVGKIAHTIGWQWTFYFVAIFSACMFPFIFFLVPEVAYRRDDSLNTDMGLVVLASNQIAVTDPQAMAGNADGEKDDSPASASVADSAAVDGMDAGEPTKSSNSPPQKISWAKSLLPFNGRKTDESYWKLFLRPFPLFFHPAILWVRSLEPLLLD
jgi:MFS family permease